MNDHLKEFFVAKIPAVFSLCRSSPARSIGSRCELERAVKQFGFKGALVNGYANIGDENHAQYPDEEPIREFLGAS